MSAIEQTELSARGGPSGRTALHWVGGWWLDSGEHRESINPATGEVIGGYALGGRKEAELAVTATLRAFRETDWKENRPLRARVLNAMAERFEARAEDLARLLSTEVGKVLPHARFETATVVPNYRPTLLEVTDSGLPIVQQEVFGPVLTMQLFDTEAEAVRLANDSEYGLAACVWSRDVDRPLRVARALQAGTIWINDWAVIRDEFEEGGFKQSGPGRLRGHAGLDDFLECKHIAFKPGAVRR